MTTAGGGYLRPATVALTSEPSARARIEGYFGLIAGQFRRTPEISSAVITHMLPDRPYFLDGLAALTTVGGVLPKPRSCDPPTLEAVATRYRCDPLNREQFADPGFVLSYLEQRAGGRGVVLLDIGGYFAPTLTHLCARFSGRILGVVEDTENGLQKYVAQGKPPCPVVSVARSPLKLPEDYPVGQSVVFSTESLLRSHGDILHGGETCVIGYGKIGRSVANTLRAKSIRTTGRQRRGMSPVARWP
jgi:adenosylhomocysteinase